jgi:hypothetical protein
MQSKLPMHLSRRCGSRTRGVSRCQSPAMPNRLVTPEVGAAEIVRESGGRMIAQGDPEPLGTRSEK